MSDHSAPVAAGFEPIWESAAAIPGWLSRGQALVLYQAVSVLPAGAQVVEIGSHQGRSTVVLAGRPGVGVTAVDPFLAGGMWGGPATQAVFDGNLVRAGVRDRVTHVAEPSRIVRAARRTQVDLVYIDGKHDYWTVSDDLRWAELLPTGGTVLMHDCFSSVGVTLAVLRHVLPGRTLAYAGRTGSLATFHRQPPSASSRLAIVRQLPWWGRNIVVKVLLRSRLRRAAAQLGHHDRSEPY